jgi:site-specific DNA-cytosine methylase
MPNSVDLFTGIGGFALALKGVYRPLLYCDNDPGVLLVLESLTRKGDLPRADLITDVKDTSAIVKAVANRKVDLLTAGFPCTGFSKSGAMKGLDNEGSSLFFHAMKAVRKLRPSVVFLENVAEIVKSADMDVIATSLRGMGYECRWTICSGSDVGSPQLRRRWFCMCVLRGFVPAALKVATQLRTSWSVKGMPRIASKRPEDFASRYSMLGNTIVPAAAWLAFVRLFTGFAVQTFEQCRRLKLVKYGFMTGEVAMPPSVPRFEILLRPDHFAGAEKSSKRAVMPATEGTTARNVFPTPRATMWRKSNVLTSRTMRDLPCFALFVSKVNGVSQPKTRANEVVNLDFMEWLMGFPVGWTKYQHA